MELETQLSETDELRELLEKIINTQKWKIYSVKNWQR